MPGRRVRVPLQQQRLSPRLADVRLLANLGQGSLRLLQLLCHGKDGFGSVEITARDRALGGTPGFRKSGIRCLERSKARPQKLPLR